jgi:hypothetical protein
MIAGRPPKQPLYASLLKTAFHSGRRAREEFAIAEGLLQALMVRLISQEHIKRLDKNGKWYTISTMIQLYNETMIQF